MLNKIFQWFTKLLVLWTLLAVAIGYFYPPALTIFKPYLDYMFMFTMLGIGFVLNPEDFLPIIKKPQLPLFGTLAQFAIMPLTSFLIAKILKLPNEYALGLIIAGSVPGAMASNVISYLAKADVVLSISITTCSTFLAPVLTPTFTYILAKTFMQVDFWAMFRSILLMVVIPLVVGLTIKHYLRNYVMKIIDFFPALSTLFIAFICGLIVALNKDKLINVTLIVFLAVFLLNTLGLLGGYLAGILYGFSEDKKRTLSIEVGMQNAGLGAVLALKHFSAAAALPSALFATWCVITASILAGIWASKK
ncbi:MAG: bile acid:sodium symporter family protein [Candidatus Goldbacteria bacterium]|nr:bile acid:sodium symporter family protein [Candidatus Goldiibacteriota bacterium]